MKTSSPKQPRIDGVRQRLQPPLPLFDRSCELVCGVDEAGRGPLAGPVFAAAVILDPERPIDGLRDSKKLTAARREALADEIRAHALSWAIASCTEAEIDELNILHASMLAMRRAIDALHRRPTLALIDGNRCPVIALRCDAIIQGDDRVAEISAASILAKTARDAALLELHAQYPEYAFDQHKGYPTPLHLARLRLHGVSPVHRRTYAPVRSLLDELAAFAARPQATGNAVANPVANPVANGAGGSCVSVASSDVAASGASVRAARKRKTDALATSPA